VVRIIGGRSHPYYITYHHFPRLFEKNVALNPISMKSLTLISLFIFVSFNLFSQVVYPASLLSNVDNIAEEISVLSGFSDLVIEAQIVESKYVNGSKDNVRVTLDVINILKGEYPLSRLSIDLRKQKVLDDINNSLPHGACTHGMGLENFRTPFPVAGRVKLLFLKVEDGNIELVINGPSIQYTFKNGSFKEGSVISNETIENIILNHSLKKISRDEIITAVKKKDELANPQKKEAEVSISSVTNRVPAGVDSVLTIIGQGFGVNPGLIEMEVPGLTAYNSSVVFDTYDLTFGKGLILWTDYTATQMPIPTDVFVSRIA
jgi:hypothetical protein